MKDGSHVLRRQAPDEEESTYSRRSPGRGRDPNGGGAEHPRGAELYRRSEAPEGVPERLPVLGPG